MAELSVVIPSRNISNLRSCVAAVRKAEETCRIIWVQDCEGGPPMDAGSWGEFGWNRGAQPFCFARNANIGIRAAGTDDVLLLNDDALLETLRGFSLMQKCISDQKPEWGVVACTTNVTGYPLQQRRPYSHQRAMRDVPFLAFVAVLIPRRTVNTVGLLDERFGGPGVYGGEDVDYCLRLREAGLKVGVSDFCYADHASLPSTFRVAHPRNSAPGDITVSNRIGREKWGDKWPHYPR